MGAVLQPGWSFRLMTVITLTAGTAFIMWLGEQITERGIGNGISLIIFAGIVCRLPQAIANTFQLMTTGELVFLRERLFGMRSGLKKPGVQRWTARITVISYLLPLRRPDRVPPPLRRPRYRRLDLPRLLLRNRVPLLLLNQRPLDRLPLRPLPRRRRRRRRHFVMLASRRLMRRSGLISPMLL